MTLHTVVFNNADAKPRSQVVQCSKSSIAPIMAWYGAYCAGDRYTVTVDWRNIKMDLNGEPVDLEVDMGAEQ